MDRKAFLKGCFAGACGCAATTLIPTTSLRAATASAEKENDGRMEFVQARYAALLGILSRHMSEAELRASLAELGADCANDSLEGVKKYRGDFDGFVKYMLNGAPNDTITWDKQRNVITMSSAERTDCVCPLVSVKHKTPGAVCSCTTGWQRRTWSTFFERDVRVEIKETVLRGGKRCVCEIHVGTVA